MKLCSTMRGNSKDLLELIKDIPSELVMAEIGCYAGESTQMFLMSNKVKILYAIDPWQEHYNGKHYPNMLWAEQSFNFRIKSYRNVIKCRGVFTDYLDELPVLDFVYIDGNHDYESVLQDIKTALLVVKKNGIIAGHDHNDVYLGVERAVSEVFGKNNVNLYKDSSWLIKL